MKERSIFKIAYWQDREPNVSDYQQFVIEVVHTRPKKHPNNREQLILNRLMHLQYLGVTVIFGVDIQDTPSGLCVVIGGTLEDVCVEKRKNYLRELLKTDNKAKIVVDLALTSRY